MRAFVVLVLVGIALVAGAALAGARSWEIAPSGSNQATSNGRLTFSASEASILCAVTLTGTLASRAEGTVGAREPRTNPRIGSFTSGRVSECSGGEVRLLFPERSWQLYIEGFEGSTAYVYVQNAQLLVTAAGGLIRCQYEAAVSMGYAEKTGQLTISGLSVLRQTALSLAICPAGPALSGTLTDIAESVDEPEVGPRFEKNPGALEYGEVIQVRRVTLTNGTAQRVQISHLVWANSEERNWRGVSLTCGTLEPVGREGNTCAIEISSKTESRNTTLEVQDEDRHQLVEIELRK
ncbi:MAG TPA: hypothetical protein VFG31_07105 [Conexibacter sp.]|nr:hypothetical protein [Conexibacter sp.]